MKTKLILVILLLGMMGLIFGSEDPAEMDEMQRKTKELKALSERFKAEKGFDGVIQTNTEVMKLSHFRGNFKDIDLNAVRDSIAFRQVCNRIVNKLLPFIAAKENQLIAGHISMSSDWFNTTYQQRANGYPIWGEGRLVISYERDYNRISILNVTVDIANQPVQSLISDTEAKQLAIDMHKNRTGRSFDNNETTISGPCYSNRGRDRYYIAYLVTIEDTTYFVDALESNVVVYFDFTMY